MNDTSHDSESVPPQIPETEPPATVARQTGQTAETATYAPMSRQPNVAGLIDALLKTPGRVHYELADGRRRQACIGLLAIAAVTLLAYGFIMGWFSGGRQLWAAPLKVSLGALASALLCFPSLYIFSCLSGADFRLSDGFGLLAGLLALAGVVLVGFAPVVWLFSVSSESIIFMGFLHLVIWLIAVRFGLGFLWRAARRVKAAEHGYLTVWVVVFILVSLQMTTTLRPLIGSADTFLPTEKRFFLNHWLESVDE